MTYSLDDRVRDNDARTAATAITTALAAALTTTYRAGQFARRAAHHVLFPADFRRIRSGS